jgi:hypothetical protein
MVLYAWGLLTTAVLFGASAEWADIGRFALGLSSAAVIACFWRDDTPAPIPRATASGWSYQRLCRLLGYSPTPLAEGRPIQVFDATDHHLLARHDLRDRHQRHRRGGRSPGPMTIKLIASNMDPEKLKKLEQNLAKMFVSGRIQGQLRELMSHRIRDDLAKEKL